jgi:hypothetical protein
MPGAGTKASTRKPRRTGDPATTAGAFVTNQCTFVPFDGVEIGGGDAPSASA